MRRKQPITSNMKKLTVSFLASLSVFALPANAFPIWAELIAESHCQYLQMGATWDESMRQAIRDNRHWLSEFNAAGRLGGKTVAYAVIAKCRALNEKAFSEHERINGTRGRTQGVI